MSLFRCVRVNFYYVFYLDLKFCIGNQIPIQVKTSIAGPPGGGCLESEGTNLGGVGVFVISGSLSRRLESGWCLESAKNV